MVDPHTESHYVHHAAETHNKEDHKHVVDPHTAEPPTHVYGYGHTFTAAATRTIRVDEDGDDDDDDDDAVDDGDGRGLENGTRGMRRGTRAGRALGFGITTLKSLTDLCLPLVALDRIHGPSPGAFG